MTFRLPFSQRIVIAFVLMTVVVSGSFSLGIVAVVHFVEAQLISKELHGKLNMILHEDIKTGKEPRLDHRTRFFASNFAQAPIPNRFADFPEGFTEIEDENEAAYVYLTEVNGVRYMLLQEQQEFENREEILFSVVLAGFLLSIVFAWGLGAIMAKQVMEPVARLAGHVRRRDQLAPLTPSLAQGYADDEIGHLAEAFDSTFDQLRRLIERERLFTSDVSHELRTPLMVISTSCELLLEKQLPDGQREQVERIARATRDMDDLVRTFLALARSGPTDDAGANSTTLTEIAQELAHIWEPAIRAKGLEFELLDEGADTEGHNPTFLRTVMANLLRNALHYTQEGKISLVLKKNAFSIADTGIGIASTDQDFIFHPFFRGEKAKGEGFGLGLSIAKRICQHKKWKIEMHKNEPNGSIFIVSFD